jgi:metallo-beta-lactamase family protein
MVRLFGEDIQVCAEIRKIDSFSSHADEKMLLKWVEDAAPGIRLFVNHGEDKVTERFAAEASELIGKPAVAPYSGEVWDLISDELVKKAVVIPVIRKEAEGGIVEIRSFDSEGKLSSRKPEYAHGDKEGEWKVTESTAKAVKAYNELCRAGNRLMDHIERCQGTSNKEIIKLTRDINELLRKHGAWED